jgi:hypothetical protein
VANILWCAHHAREMRAALRGCAHVTRARHMREQSANRTQKWRHKFRINSSFYEYGFSRERDWEARTIRGILQYSRGMSYIRGILRYSRGMSCIRGILRYSRGMSCIRGILWYSRGMSCIFYTLYICRARHSRSKRVMRCCAPHACDTRIKIVLCYYWPRLWNAVPLSWWHLHIFNHVDYWHWSSLAFQPMWKDFRDSTFQISPLV